MNVYDFDGTILTGDTEDYFRKYIYKNYKIKVFDKLKVDFYGLLYSLKLINADKFRNNFYPYVKYLPNLDKIVKEFWDEHFKYIKPYYFKNHQDDDVVVSATPRFLLEDVMKRLNIKTLICTELDIKTTKIIGKVCREYEKVKRYNEVFNEKEFENYYFDQDHDMPLMKYSKNGYRVKGDILIKEK